MAMRFKFPKPRFTLKTAMVAVACCGLAFWAAPRGWDYFKVLWQTPSVYDRGWFDHELHAWPEAERPVKFPGVDEGSCLRVRTSEATGFVIWTDFRWSPASRGGRMNGFLVKPEKEGEQEVVQWQWKADGGKAGTLMINDAPYTVDEGSLFLVSTQNGKVQAKQFNKDALALVAIPSGRLIESLRALAKSDKDIGSFFVEAAKRK